MYYHAKAWRTQPPYSKGAQLELPEQPPKPPYRPGYWVLFKDPVLCPDIPEIAGKIEYVTNGANGLSYEIRVIWSMFSVPESAIIAKLTRGA